MYCLPSSYMFLEILLQCQNRWWVNKLPGMHFWRKLLCDIVSSKTQNTSHTDFFWKLHNVSVNSDVMPIPIHMLMSDRKAKNEGEEADLVEDKRLEW